MPETPAAPDIRLDATDRSPAVVFDFGTQRLSISGESYPEDAAAFYGPLLQALGLHLADPAPVDVSLDIRLVYFNSSSAKALMNMFQMLEDAAAGGGRVTINWHYHNDDDTMEEFGEDFSEDFVHARFVLCPQGDMAP